MRLYTGDDFNYPELIASGSDALLGIFDAIAPAAAAALAALDAGDRDEYDRILAPTVPLARKLFEAPTFNYKTGIVFLAWVNGHQEHFRHARRAWRPRARPSTWPRCSSSPTAPACCATRSWRRPHAAGRLA